MKACITIWLLMFFLTGFSQTNSINLSPTHQKKISKIGSGHKRMVKFYKYYKKDSARYVKKLNKQYKKTLDSTMLAESLKTNTTPLIPDSLAEATAFNRDLQKWKSILADSTASDSARAIASEQIRILAIERARQYPGFQHLEGQYIIRGDSVSWEDLITQAPGLDSLNSLFDSDPKSLFTQAEILAEQKLADQSGVGSLMGDFGKVESIKGLTEQYKQSYAGYLGQDDLGQVKKEDLASKALDYFAENPEKLEFAQQRVSKLLSKYQTFSNSSNLADAKKHTSMEGKTLFERLVVGGNFNVLSTSPVSLDVSPQLGYKFTTRFVVGVGMNYRIAFSDSIKHTWYITPSNTSFKGFISYDIIKSWFAYVEGEWSGVRPEDGEQSKRINWEANYFVGAGRKFLIHPKVFMTLTALYNLNTELHNQVYPRRFQMRVGFHLSELATRKKATIYNPN